jgi:hypothetical protein
MRLPLVERWALLKSLVSIRDKRLGISEAGAHELLAAVCEQQLEGLWESEGTAPTNPASASGCGWLAGNSRSTAMSPSGTPLKFSELGDSRTAQPISPVPSRPSGRCGFEVAVRWAVVRSLQKK